MADLDAASGLIAAHARLLDRRRFELLFRDGSPDGRMPFALPPA